jgi:hypothetical protein
MLSISDFSTAITLARAYYGIAEMPLSVTPQAVLIYADGGVCVTPEAALGDVDGQRLRELIAAISDDDWFSLTR